MSKFAYLKKNNFTDKTTVDYSVPYLGDEAILKVCPATQVNKAYQNEILRKSNNAIRVNSKANDDSLRKTDRELYPKYIIKGWSNVVDNSGKKIPFSEKNAIDLCEQLPDWMFDEIRVFVLNPHNFIKDAPNVEEVSKN